MKTRQSLASVLMAGALLFASAAQATTVVRMETVLGEYDVWLRDDINWVPGARGVSTTQNFMNYVNSGAYNNSFIHRNLIASIKVVQGGSFFFKNSTQSIDVIPEDAPIDFNVGLPNRRGTIAMAQLAGNQVGHQNTATSGWFINVSDNSVPYGYYGYPRFGYTAFGTVLGDGMTVVDAINQLTIHDITTLNTSYGAFNEIPLISYTDFDPLLKENLVLITRVTKIAEKPGLFIPVKGTDGVYTFIGSDLPAVTDAYIEMPANPSPSDAPAGVTFDHGFFAFNLTTDTNGGKASTTLTLPEGQRLNTFYKYGPTPDNHAAHWYEFMWDGQTGAVIGPEPNVAKLVFVDGLRGDDDYTADSKISNLGAPGIDSSLGSASSAVGTGGNYTTLRVDSPDVVIDDFKEGTTNDTITGLEINEGAFKIKLSNVSTGPESVVLTLPQSKLTGGKDPNLFFYSLNPSDPNPSWDYFMWDGQTGAVLGPDGHVVRLVFVDGQRGDGDHTVNGKIEIVGLAGYSALLSTDTLDQNFGFSSSAVGASGSYTTIRTEDTELVLNTFAAANNPSPDDAPAGVSFGEGFFEIKLDNVLSFSNNPDDVGIANVLITLPRDQHPNTYYKYGKTPDNHTPHWYEFMWDGKTGATFGLDKNYITLVFVDGERGDDDLTVNGTVVDVGAPGFKAGSSGGGGGAADVWSLLVGLLAISWRVVVRHRYPGVSQL